MCPAATGPGRRGCAGSVHAFDQRHPRIDESSPRATDPALGEYDRSKWTAEQLLQDVVHNGLDAVICNPTGIYGPRDCADLSRLNRIVRDAAAGRLLVVVEGGFDLVDVRDVARGLVLAAEHGRRGENYLLPGHRWRILDLCRQAAALAGRRGPRWSLPMGVARRLAPVLDAPLRWAGIDAMSPHAMMALDAFPEVDGSKAARELGYRPRPPEETLQDLVRFLVEQGWLDGRRRSRRAWARSQPTVSPTGRSTTAATASSSTSCRS